MNAFILRIVVEALQISTFLIAQTYFVSAKAASEARSTLTRVVGTATQTGGAIETQVLEAVVRGNVACLAREPAFTVAHKVIQLVLAFVAMARVWVTVVVDYMGTNTRI